MKLAYKNGITSVVLRVKIMDSASVTGGAKTGLTSGSAGLIISTIADNEAAPTVYAQAAGNIETIAVLGTYAAPTAGKCRFKEVDATNHPGLYEIQIADARWAVNGARSVVVTASGASGAAQVDLEIQLDPLPADALKINSNATAAANAKNAFDGATGYVFTNSVMPVVTGVTNTVLADIRKVLSYDVPVGTVNGALVVDLGFINGGEVTGETSQLDANVISIGGSTTAAGNLLNALNGTGYNFPGCTIPTVTNVTNLHASAATLANQIAIAGYIDTEVGAIKLRTDNLPNNPAATGDAMTLANGAITTATIADDAITDAKIAFPAEAAGRPAKFLAAMRRVWEWRANKRTRNRTTGAVVLRNAADDGDLETATQSTALNIDTQTKGI